MKKVQHKTRTSLQTSCAYLFINKNYNKTHKHLNNILLAVFSAKLTTYICLYDIILNGFYREAFKMERAILCLLNVVSLLGKPQNDDS